MNGVTNLFEYMPSTIKNLLNILSNRELSGLNEITLINGQALILQINGYKYFMSSIGICTSYDNVYIVKDEDIKKTYELITRSSNYAYNRYIKDGFITLPGGHRVGIVGECIVENSIIINVKNINSICFRIAQDFQNNAILAFEEIYNKNTIYNTIIISPPGAGKTTFLRGIASLIGGTKNKNIVKCAIIDERFEIAGCVDGKSTLASGVTSVTISGCEKKIAIPLVVRSMGPEVIIIDELATQDDIYAIKYAKASGCKIIATTHGYNEYKNELANYNYDGIFEKTIVLSRRNGPGTIEKILHGEINDT